MVDATKYLPQEFSETETISSTNMPEGNLKITRADEVTVNSGPRAGQTVLVIEVSDSNGKTWTYWPNKTSIGNLAREYGNDTDRWIGKTVVLTTETMMVRGSKRKVIFAEPA